MNNTYYYQDKPLFGIDIGFSSIKVMQMENTKKQHTVIGYGVTDFDSSCIKEGIIVNPEPIAQSLMNLFANGLMGQVNTRRAAFSVPASKTYTRTMVVPTMETKDLAEAVRLEAEQYIPVPLDDLYIDHSIMRRDAKQIELLAVATPKNIVDSYIQLAELIGVEPVAIEPTTNSSGRLFIQAERNDVPTILIDLGSISTDITIFDQTLIVTGTVQGGGNNITELISKGLNVSPDEAQTIKNKYGLSVSKKQAEIISAIKPLLDDLLKEMRRVVRYYEERAGSNKKISQIITLGGGANMPGLSEAITDQMRIPTRMCDPWQHFYFHNLPTPQSSQKSLFVTVAGLALMNTREVFND